MKKDFKEKQLQIEKELKERKIQIAKKTLAFGACGKR